MERGVPIVCRNIYVAARNKELFRNGHISGFGRELERRVPIIILEVDVKNDCFKQLFGDSLIAICCRNYERCRSILSVKINVAASYNQLLRDGRLVQQSRDVERRVSKIALVVNPGLRVCRKKHLPNSHCITVTQRQKECGCWLGLHGCPRLYQHAVARCSGTIFTTGGTRS